ncbi:tetratricopeptide repeat protein, partial [bacterium]|nr:tetratricopeptide repeat protein [bacterium]
ILSQVQNLREQGRFFEAIDLIGYVLESEPQNEESLLQLAELYSKIGNWTLANYYYSILLNKTVHPSYLTGKITALRQLGLWEEASQYSSDLLEHQKSDPLAISTLAFHYYQIGEFPKSLGYYDRLSASDTIMLQGVGWCHLMMKNFDKAKEVFHEVLSKDRGNLSASEGLRVIERQKK